MHNLSIEPIYPDHRIRPQKLRQNSSSHLAGPDKYRFDLIIADSESLSPPPFLTLRDMKANID